MREEVADLPEADKTFSTATQQRLNDILWNRQVTANTTDLHCITQGKELCIWHIAAV